MHPCHDDFGRVHMILSGDYKQLPPATGRPPFIGADAQIMCRFTFRVLRQNRRLAPATDSSKQKALDDFHEVLEDVAHNRSTQKVRDHLVAAYVRGALKSDYRVDLEKTQRASRNESTETDGTKSQWNDCKKRSSVV